MENKRMSLSEAKEELKDNINLNFSHAVLLKDKDGYYTELHGGHAGNCCCCSHEDFVWRASGPYTHDSEIDTL